MPKFSIQVRGSDDAPPLLLLPGQANSHRWWDGLREPFAERLRTITFDYRGTGETEASDGEWTTATFAEDAAAVLDEVGVARTAVYGTSMGGRIAQRLAIDQPGRVSALVLACTTPGGRHAIERSQEVRRMLAEPDRERRRANLLELFYTDGRRESNLLGDPGLTPQAARRHLRVSASHDAWDGLPGITVPTLVLHGSEDRMAPVENARLLAHRIPAARLSITAGGRHGFFDEFAEAVTPEVVAFLRT
ncbi:alpha/beta fold hydrolase [Solirubrobacter sp. CPCC 204708]|uniref:Alpha/beta hydrolase n=1 Tax=Solirubrobacter deserti TaxID=2282478 RepID=A0ABT4RCN5_9ACTN|nr:alpha/beta hydrolase [Solirubrobacter deserti]MBE2315662.1 alpha/beta fold hydrolase [Solirubrobacter deserti]MDA0136302.1 alpha/beta hydrolase [Solirubrobacter deserti]